MEPKNCTCLVVKGGGVQRVENLNGYWYYICSVSMFFKMPGQKNSSFRHKTAKNFIIRGVT